MGHSAGAHLCQMALLHRAAAAHAAACVCAGQRPPGNDTSPHPGTASSSSSSSSPSPLQLSDPRMPQQFVAITGVYDIASHYEYERQRGVHELSTMKRAMGGEGGFADMSPAVILRDALYTHQQQQHRPQQQQQQDAGHGDPHTIAGVAPVQTPRGLAGEVVAARVGEFWFRAAAGTSSVAQSATTCQALSATCMDPTLCSTTHDSTVLRPCCMQGWCESALLGQVAHGDREGNLPQWRQPQCTAWL